MKHFVRRVVCPLCLAVMSLQAPAVLAQTDTPSAPTLSVKARLVILDVTVTDKQGKPVDGLTSNDFQVFEDGKPQTIRSFETPGSHAMPPVSAANEANAAEEVFDPAKPANFGRAPVTILVLDQLNTHFADSSFARRELAKYLDKQPALLAQPTTLLTVYQDHFKVLEGFTRDRNKLSQALTKAPVEYSWTFEASGKADYSPLERLDTSLRSLEEMANSYARVPGRKNVIWIGGGFPSIDPSTLATKDMAEVNDDVRHVTDVLLDARATLYAVDPTTTAAGMSEITDFQEMAFAELAGSLDSINSDPIDHGAGFDELSALSGGRVIRSMNNVATQIALSVDYGSQFYTISYSPTNASDVAQGFRKIKVVCTKPGLAVTTRTGYYTGGQLEGKSNERISYDLSTAAESKMPLNALHVTVEGDPSVAVLNDEWIIRVEAPGLTWTPADDGSSKAEVEILAASLSRQGKILGHVLHSASAVAHAGVNVADTSKMAVFSFAAKAVAKTSVMRFVVRDASTGRMGSFDIPLK